MSTLSIPPNTFSAPPNTITLHSANKEVLRITADGRLVAGEGLSAEEATQEAAKLMIASFEEQIQKMVETRIARAEKAEAELAEVESQTAATLLKMQQRNADLRAEVERLTVACNNFSNAEIAEGDWKARAERAEAALAIERQTLSGTIKLKMYFEDEMERLLEENVKLNGYADMHMKEKARAERAEAALAFIASNGGTTHETECGPIACNGCWCAEQARAALDATKEDSR
jgi:hypothetical protein